MLRLAALTAVLLAACGTDGDDGDIVGPYTGEVARYTVDRFDLPVNNVTARDLGDDLDGDKAIDNQLGMVLATLGSQGDITKHGQDMIASGALASYIEIQADDPLTDDRVGVWYYGADGDTAVPMGGTLDAGVFTSNRTRDTHHAGTATVRLPALVDVDPTVLEVTGMQLDLTPDGHGGFDGLVRAKMTQDVVRSAAYTGILAMFAAQPQDHRVFWYAVDNNHDGVLPEPEFFRDKGLMVALLSSDLDDGLSFGFRIHLSPAGSALPVIADRCFDRIHDGTETGLDCGGSCIPCGAAQSCSIPADCQSGTCLSGTCTAPSCADGQLSGFESDVDCGGPCGDCATGKSCDYASDCASGDCHLGVCS